MTLEGLSGWGGIKHLILRSPALHQQQEMHSTLAFLLSALALLVLIVPITYFPPGPQSDLEITLYQSTDCPDEDPDHPKDPAGKIFMNMNNMVGPIMHSYTLSRDLKEEEHLGFSMTVGDDVCGAFGLTARDVGRTGRACHRMNEAVTCFRLWV